VAFAKFPLRIEGKIERDPCSLISFKVMLEISPLKISNTCIYKCADDANCRDPIEKFSDTKLRTAALLPFSIFIIVLGV